MNSFYGLPLGAQITTVTGCPTSRIDALTQDKPLSPPENAMHDTITVTSTKQVNTSYTYRPMPVLCSLPGYDADALLDSLMKDFNLKNDAALARLLEVAPPMISKLRNGHASVTADMLLRMHDKTELSIRALRSRLGVGQVS